MYLINHLNKYTSANNQTVSHNIVHLLFLDQVGRSYGDLINISVGSNGRGCNIVKIFNLSSDI